MNDATRAAHQAGHPATLRLPVAFDYPRSGILGRTAIGLALLALGAAMLLEADILWISGGLVVGAVGAVAAASNLSALLDPDRRKIVLDEEGVEIRYGLSRRRYRFLDYSDYRISRLGVRRFLTALPIDVEQRLGNRAEEVRVTLHDRPAFLTPMPMLGNGAPATLLEWQATLNELRRAALAAAGVTHIPTVDTPDRAEEARRAANWGALAQAGARPSRLSRAGYARGRLALTLAFFVLLVAPIAFSAAVQHGAIAVCGAESASGCLDFDPGLYLVVMIGGPALAVLVFMIGNAWMAMRRAHDLDEDIGFWRAAFASLARHGALRRRLAGEDGTPGTNRFGPATGA
ncbi:MAG TPA: hypothetical protein VJ822_09965 [Dongiaceae bacterium]|nr:hypothetical protein [Dongiaceae bacterium]